MQHPLTTYDKLLTWADLYDKSTFEAKKMIVAQFVRAVRVGRNYAIEIDINGLLPLKNSANTETKVAKIGL